MAVSQMLSNLLLMSRTRIDSVPMGRTLRGLKWRRQQPVAVVAEVLASIT